MSVQGMTPEAANRFLDIEPRLVTLIRAGLTAQGLSAHVTSAAAAHAAADARLITPAVHIAWAGYEVKDDAASTRVLLTHTWHAVVVVRTVDAASKSGAAARSGAGPLLECVMNTIAGAVIEGVVRPARLTTPPAPWFEDGTQYLPVSFELQTIFHKRSP